MEDDAWGYGSAPYGLSAPWSPPPSSSSAGLPRRRPGHRPLPPRPGRCCGHHRRHLHGRLLPPRPRTSSLPQPRPIALLCLLLLWRGAAGVSSAASRVLEEAPPADGSGSTAGPATTKVFDPQTAALLRFAAGLVDPHESLVTWAPETAGHPCGGVADGAGDSAGGAAAAPWPGVECDEPRGSVIGVDLAGRGLEGTLGASLAELPALRSM